jgi:hypothetical protein
MRKFKPPPQQLSLAKFDEGIPHNPQKKLKN